MKSDGYLVTNQDIYDCVHSGGDPSGRTWVAKTTIPQTLQCITHADAEDLIYLDTSSFVSGWSDLMMVKWEELSPTTSTTTSTTTQAPNIVLTFFGSIFQNTIIFRLENTSGVETSCPCDGIVVNFNYTQVATKGASVTFNTGDKEKTFTGDLSSSILGASFTGVSPSTCGNYTFETQSGDIS